MSELSPAAEARDVQLAATRLRRFWITLHALRDGRLPCDSGRSGASYKKSAASAALFSGYCFLIQKSQN